MLHFSDLVVLFAAVGVATSTPLDHSKRDQAAPSLPIVNLGYERHQAISFNQSTGIYNFSNIRYGQAPVGDLRWRAPLPVNGTSDAVDNGSVGRVCAQQASAWNSIAQKFASQYFSTGNQTFDYDAALATLPNATVLSGKLLDPRTTEDCLFLDVHVPKVAFTPKCPKTKLPVLVYIYGGGFTSGEKSIFDPSAIIADTNNSMIFVALNYRLGAFGWLASKEVQADGTLNAGFHDQRLGLEWVQKYIHLFGGDASRVTVAGGSAGASSIEHHIASYGGQGGPLPFAQAITSSPAFFPVPNITQYAPAYSSFLKVLNVSTLEEARKLPTEKLILANTAIVWSGSYGSNGFGPVVDGTYAPTLPGVAFLNGSFHKDVKVFTTHASDEGFLFADPRVNTSAGFEAHIKASFPFISNSAFEHLTQDLYPPVYDGSFGYTNDFERNKIGTQDSSLICNANYLDRAFDNQTYAVQFSVFPGLHGQDTDYIFPVASAKNTAFPFNETIAESMQQIFANIVTKGNPGLGVPQYGPGSKVLDLSNSGVGIKKDMAANERCYWWQQAKYYYK